MKHLLNFEDLTEDFSQYLEQEDMDLIRVVCYIASTSEFRQVSWVGDPMADVWLRQFADADLASDPRTHRSTSACNLKLWGPNTRANQSFTSRRQT